MFSFTARPVQAPGRSAFFSVMRQLSGAALPPIEEVRGIFHSSGGAFGKCTVKRSCMRVIFPAESRFTCTTGNPGCSVHAAAISPTGFLEARESAFQRSAVVVFESLWAVM